MNNKNNDYIALLDEFYNSYDYIDISKVEFNEMINKKISKLDNNEYQYLEIIIEEEITKYISKELLNNSKAFKIISNYINKKMKDTSTYDIALKEIIKLENFFNVCNYFPSPDLLIELISKNQIFKSVIEIIINKDYEKIVSGEYYSYYDSELLIQIINIYCMLYDISIDNKDIYEEDKFVNIDLSDNYAVYINDIKNKPRLSPEEEKDLALKIKKGDKKAKERFIEGNLKLVVSIAKRYIGRGVSFMDLIQEGNIGLMIAAEKYDPNKGRFSTYAYSWILQKILRLIEYQGRNIRIPSYMQNDLKLRNGAINYLEDELNRTPTTEEVAEYLNFPVEKVIRLYEGRLDTVSINSKIGDDNFTLEKIIPSDDTPIDEVVAEESINKQIRELIETSELTTNEKIVIKYRFGLVDGKEYKQTDIARMLGLTRERIRQLLNRAIKKLKKVSELRQIYGKDDNVAARKTIYEYFKEYTKEEIDNMLQKLSTKEKELIKLRYGDNLEQLYNGSLDRIQTNKFYGSLLPKMKRLLANPNLVMKKRGRKKKIVPEIIIDNTPHTEDTENNLTEKNIINNNDTNVEEVDVVSNISIDSVEEQCVTSEESIVEKSNNEMSKEDCIKMLELIKTPTFYEMLQLLSPKEAIIISLKLGYIDDKYFSTESIANFLDISEEEVNETIKKMLLLYKDKINTFIDNIIVGATEGKVLIKK